MLYAFLNSPLRLLDDSDKILNLKPVEKVRVNILYYV